MRRAIITATIGEKFAPMAALTMSTQVAYAERMNAAFLVLKDTPEQLGTTTAHWAKFHIGGLLDDYAEVLWLDADIAVNPSAPSVFETAGGQLAAYHEGDVAERREQFYDYYQALRGVIIRGRLIPQYFNSGVMVVPKSSRAIFSMPSRRDVELTVRLKQEQPGKYFYDQNLLNARVLETGASVKRLDERWNLMNVTSGDKWERRTECGWFVHYAGLLNSMGPTLLPVIKSDLEKWGVG